MRWECRHSSAEMLYLEVRSDGVYEWFDHHPDDPTIWSFEAVAAGEIDGMVGVLFGDDAVAELKARATEAIARRRPS